MKSIAMIVSVLVLAGCYRQPDGDVSVTKEYEVDQAMRREVFASCLKNLPAGPKATKYNDWDEVVDSCAQTAYYQALVCVSGCKLKGTL